VTRVLVTQRGRDLAVDAPGGLPDAVVSMLDDALSYQERIYDQFLGGFNYVTRKQYVLSADGRSLATLSGMRYRVLRTLYARRVPYDFVADPYYASDVFVPDWANVARLFAFRGRQDECLAALASTDCGVVEASTGWGKTFVIAALHALYPKARAAVLTKSVDVYQQNFAKLTELLGPSVGQVGGGKCRPGPLTVCTADSAHKLGFELDLVVGDEIHELAAERYLGVLANYRRARMFGFTASLERDDNRHHELEAVFGPVLFTLPFVEAVALQCVAPVAVEWLKPDCRFDPADGVANVTDRERLAVWRNEERNRSIARRVRKFRPDESVVVMTKTLEHACLLKQQMPEFTLCYAENEENRETIDGFKAAGLLPANEPRMTGVRREELRRDFRLGHFRKAIATYVWSTGIDFPVLGALVRADAGGSRTKDAQIPGRVCRLFEGKSAGLVVDCWDDFSDNLLTRSRSRKRNYGRRGYTQRGPYAPPAEAVLPGGHP
jgi:superfamily II DNA or RNA helicase